MTKVKQVSCHIDVVEIWNTRGGPDAERVGVAAKSVVAAAAAVLRAAAVDDYTVTGVHNRPDNQRLVKPSRVGGVTWCTE